MEVIPEPVDGIARRRRSDRLVGRADHRALHRLVGQVDFRGEDRGQSIRDALSVAEVGKPLRTGRLVEDDGDIDVRRVVRLAASLRAEEGKVPHTHALEFVLMGKRASVAAASSFMAA